jgi:hypothetical protein
VVGDQHEAPGADLGAQRSGRVGEHEDLGTGGAEGADGRANRVELPAFVDVGAALEHRHGHRADAAEHRAAAVACHRRARKAGEVGVVDRGLVHDGIRHRSQPGAEHDPDARLKPGALGQDPGGLPVRHPRGSKSNASGRSSPTVVV